MSSYFLLWMLNVVLLNICAVMFCKKNRMVLFFTQIPQDTSRLRHLSRRQPHRPEQGKVFTFYFLRIFAQLHRRIIFFTSSCCPQLSRADRHDNITHTSFAYMTVVFISRNYFERASKSRKNSYRDSEVATCIFMFAGRSFQ